LPLATVPPIVDPARSIASAVEQEAAVRRAVDAEPERLKE
jgi:hypothetical protein